MKSTFPCVLSVYSLLRAQLNVEVFNLAVSLASLLFRSVLTSSFLL